MAAISAAAVNELRKRTDLPMMECKSALVEADGDLEKAVEILRVRNKGVGVKRAGNETGEGRVGLWFDPSHQKASIVELRSESAPVANSEQFMTLARDLARHVAEHPNSTIEAILTQPFVDKPSITVADRINEAIGLLRENMKLARFQVLTGDGYYGGYVHHNGSVGALVKLSAKPEPEDLGRDVAMHVVAYQPTPIAVNQSEVPADVVAKEKSIAQQKAEATGKPGPDRGANCRGPDEVVVRRERPDRTAVRQGLVEDGRPSRQGAEGRGRRLRPLQSWREPRLT